MKTTEKYMLKIRSREAGNARVTVQVQLLKIIIDYLRIYQNAYNASLNHMDEFWMLRREGTHFSAAGPAKTKQVRVGQVGKVHRKLPTLRVGTGGTRNRLSHSDAGMQSGRKKHRDCAKPKALQPCRQLRNPIRESTLPYPARKRT